MKFKNLNNFITKIPAKNLAEMATKRVAFIGNCEELYTYFKKINPNCKHFSITKKNWKNVIAKLKDKNNMPKFDVIVGNPPYEGKEKLYIKILEKCNVNNCSVIWLCPSQWVRNYEDSNYLKSIKNGVCKNIISHEFLGNPFANAIVDNDIGIFVFGENDVYEDYNDIKYERFINPVLAKSICEKFEKFTKNDNVAKHNKIDLDKKYYVKGSHVRGNVENGKPKWDWTTLFGEEQHTNFEKDLKNRWNFWNFSTKTECENFISSTETDILMFALYIVKANNSNSEGSMRLMPWLGDYTKKWTENEIANKLNLTKEEVEYIHQEMANFGWKAAPRKKNNVIVTNVPTIDKEQINKLNAKAMVMRKTFTAKQNKIYHKMFDGEWAKINKRIDLNNKLERSLAFAKARISCAKKVLM